MDYQKNSTMGEIEKEYLPLKIDYSWTDKNEDFMREVLFFYFIHYM